MSYLDDLRSGSFIAASGVEHFFKFDNVSRTIGKKLSTSEILDSNESITQDQGNTATRYPFDLYFIGENYHIESDAFWEAISESYAQDRPGLLKHPRYGDIEVIPTGCTQSEAFVDGARVGKFSVEFIRNYRAIHPESDSLNAIDALENLRKMRQASQEALNAIKKDIPFLQNLRNKLSGAVEVISDSLSGLVQLQEGLIEQFEAIQAGIDNALDDVGTNIFNIVASTQYLMGLPARIITDTQDKINGYKDMITDLITNFSNEDEVSETNKYNNGILLMLISGYGVGSLADAANFTNFQTRGEAIEGIGVINSGYEEYLQAMENSKRLGLVQNLFIGDHNFLLFLERLIKLLNLLLLNKSFDLKVEKKFVPTQVTDMISLCWKFYGNVDNETLDFFIKTNNLKFDEFIEINPDREVVFYG